MKHTGCSAWRYQGCSKFYGQSYSLFLFGDLHTVSKITVADILASDVCFSKCFATKKVLPFSQRNEEDMLATKLSIPQISKKKCQPILN